MLGKDKYSSRENPGNQGEQTVYEVEGILVTTMHKAYCFIPMYHSVPKALLIMTSILFKKPPTTL